MCGCGKLNVAGDGWKEAEDLKDEAGAKVELRFGLK